nr:recombinase family protein [uncultured Rhodopila sp.]
MMEASLTPHIGRLVPERIQRRHRERSAIVYVRQSTVQQVERHQESTRLQYALVERAFQFGWPREAIIVIDDDLGRSGATIEGRLGFQRLVAEVGLGNVGLVLGVEMSRLARSCRDWHQLLEICWGGVKRLARYYGTTKEVSHQIRSLSAGYAFSLRVMSSLALKMG